MATHLNWRTFVPILLIVLLLGPRLKSASQSLEEKIRAREEELALVEHLMDHRASYEKWGDPGTGQGVDLWGSADAAELIAELEKVSQATAVPIMDVQPKPREDFPAGEMIGAGIRVQAKMPDMGRFIYEILQLPGMVRIEKASFGEGDPGQVSADISITRRVPPRR